MIKRITTKKQRKKLKRLNNLIKLLIKKNIITQEELENL